MKKAIYLFALVTICVLSSCEEVEKCYPPTWKGFTYSPSTVHPGDSVVVTAVQAKKGHYLNATDYRFELKLQLDTLGTTKDTTLVCSYHTNYGGTDSENPKCTFHIPSCCIKGNYKCSFTARWSNSADGEMGTYPCTNDNGYWGSITSYCYTLYSTANGSFTLPIKQ